MNQPIPAATTAMIVPARNAFTMKWNASAFRTSSTRFHVSRTFTSVRSMTVTVVHLGVIGRGLRMSDDDEAPVRRVQHLDGRSVEAAQRLGGDHVARIAARGAATREIYDPIEETEDRVHV